MADLRCDSFFQGTVSPRKKSFALVSKACCEQVRILDMPAGPSLDAVLARLPHASVLAQLQPFGGQPLGSLAWAGPTPQGQALITGSESNDIMHLWHLDGDGMHARHSLLLVPGSIEAVSALAAAAGPSSGCQCLRHKWSPGQA